MSQLSAPAVRQDWPWPDSLDALQAAPAHHEVFLENDRVRVIHTHIPAGDTVPLHTHRWPGVACLLSSSDFIRRDQEGNVLLDSRHAGAPPSIPAVQMVGAAAATYGGECGTFRDQYPNCGAQGPAVRPGIFVGWPSSG